MINELACGVHCLSKRFGSLERMGTCITDLGYHFFLVGPPSPGKNCASHGTRFHQWTKPHWTMNFRDDNHTIETIRVQKPDMDILPSRNSSVHITTGNCRLRRLTGDGEGSQNANKSHHLSRYCVLDCALKFAAQPGSCNSDWLEHVTGHL
jgi:hypothetical protein